MEWILVVINVVLTILLGLFIKNYVFKRENYYSTNNLKKLFDENV